VADTGFRPRSLRRYTGLMQRIVDLRRAHGLPVAEIIDLQAEVHNMVKKLEHQMRQ